MKFFIDFEFDGDTIVSLAVVPLNPDYLPFYEVAVSEVRSEWVREHVVPHLNRDPIGLPALVQKLGLFLSQFSDWEFIADWPTDVSLLASLLHDGNGKMLPSAAIIGFTVWRVDPVSALPHNALADALALREVYWRGG